MKEHFVILGTVSVGQSERNWYFRGPTVFDWTERESEAQWYDSLDKAQRVALILATKSPILSDAEYQVHPLSY